jgi:cytochrome P450
MSDLGKAAKFATALYRDRAATLYHGYVRRRPMALLGLRPGRVSPYRFYDELRARGTLVPTAPGIYATASHRVCGTVLRDRRFVVRLDNADRDPGQLGLSFLGMNPPDHTRLRRLAQPAFSPRAMAGYTPRIERTVAGLLDSAAAAGEFDLVAAYAGAVPIAVITDLLGVPDADSAYFARVGAIIGSALGGIHSLRHAAALNEARTGLFRLFKDLMELRRAEPRDDVISRLVAAEGDQVQPEEMLPMLGLLLVAGFETTVNLIGNAVLALLSHPEQWQELCADPAGLTAGTVDEVLRWDPPVQLTARLAAEPAEIEGRTIRHGDEIITLIGGANRDPEAWDDPDTFDIHRQSTLDHLAFSSGIHYCLGRPLAILEARIALRALAERMPRLALAGRVERRNSTIIRGPVRVPVTATRHPVHIPAPA